MITEAADIVQRRRMEFQSCITMLNKDIEDCDEEGEEKHEILYFMRANWLRRTIQKKENLVRSLDGTSFNLKKEKKKIFDES